MENDTENRYTRISWGDYFYLDETSPSGLRRKVPIFCGKDYLQEKYKKDDVAGSICKQGNRTSWQLNMNYQMYRLHRIVWILNYGSIEKDMVIDHLDGDATNNSISNLALKTKRENAQNTHKSRANTSGYTGVKRDKNSWAATWQKVDGKSGYKAFSIAKFGDDLALALAVSFREQELHKLNEQGMSYTERHIYNNKGVAQ